jgi:RNA polymerase sigma-70 factor (ECF subfamily)
LPEAEEADNFAMESCHRPGNPAMGFPAALPGDTMRRAIPAAATVSEPTTTTLIRDFAGGRRETFRALYQRVAPRLFVWCSLRLPQPLRPRLDAEDLMQEIWLRAVASLPRFDRSRAGFRNWLFGIAANTLAENLRRLHRRQREVRAEDGDIAAALAKVPADVTSVVQQVARKEQMQRLVAAAEKLDADDRRLLLYRGLEALPYAEVARLCGIGVDAAEMRWRRLLQRLRSEWSAAGLGET